jgi:hypothetical protein
MGQKKKTAAQRHLLRGIAAANQRFQFLPLHIVQSERSRRGEHNRA